MRYTGKLFYPRGAVLRLDVSSLSAIQGRAAYDLYARLKREMGHDEFDARVAAAPPHRPVLLRFRRVGQTACHVTFEREQGDEGTVLEAAMAVLARLDASEDEAALDELQAEPALDVIARDDFDDARRHAGPLVATFFVAEAPLNDPLIHGLMNLSGGAFFDRLGLLE